MPDLKNNKYKRLKLDKFVGGKEQRIFKTTTTLINEYQNRFNSVLNTELEFNLGNVDKREYKDLSKKDVYYGEYSSSKYTENKLIGSDILSGNLINFHDIEAEYLANRPDKVKVLNFNGTKNPWFPTEAKKAEENIEKNKDERITYFPEYIHTPIDIAYSKNNAYMLLPLNTERYSNIVQSDTMLNLQDKGYNASSKENYKDLIKHELSCGFKYAEDNSVPIYDLNFTFLETINISNHSNCIDFLTTHNLLNFTYTNSNNEIIALSSAILINSETGKFDENNSDSILIKPLIETLIKFPQLFGQEKIKTIMQDLIGRIELYSSIRFLSPIGHITQLNDNIINDFENDKILQKDFINENIFDIKRALNEKQENIDTPEILPQNAVLNIDLRYPLKINEVLKNTDKFYSRSHVPSAYFNIAFMKNNRNPHYDINYTYPDNIDSNGKFYLYDYSINYKPSETTIIKGVDKRLNNELSGGFAFELVTSDDVEKINITKSNLPIIAQHYKDKNFANNTLYDIDITHSLEVNHDKEIENVFNDLNKNKTKEILDYAISADLNLAQSDSIYNYKFPSRIKTKYDDYLEPYKNYHIANNKLYNLGTLDGIRNYIKVGTLLDSDKLWFSYKYKSVTDNGFISRESKEFNLPDININLNRLEKNWILDIYGNIKKYQVMKTANTLCPWKTHGDFTGSVSLTKIQKLLGCNCSKSEQCTGFCTFPVNNSLNIPCGIGSTDFMIISGLTYDSHLYANTDIEVADDIEIYFIPSENITKTIEEIKSAEKSLETISGMFKSIFNGFGGYDEQTAVHTAPEYLAVNNSRI